MTDNLTQYQSYLTGLKNIQAQLAKTPKRLCWLVKIQIWVKYFPYLANYFNKKKKFVLLATTPNVK